MTKMTKMVNGQNDKNVQNDHYILYRYAQPNINYLYSLVYPKGGDNKIHTFWKTGGVSSRQEVSHLGATWFCNNLNQNIRNKY